MAFTDRLHNRGSVPTGYEIDNSVKLEADTPEYFTKAQAQGDQRTWTFSTWIKRTELSTNSGEPYMKLFSAGNSSADNGPSIYFRGDASYPNNQIFLYLDNGGTLIWNGYTEASFRDTSAWYHIVWAVDTTQATSTDRSKLYVNGVLQTLLSATYPPQNALTRVNDNGGDMAVGSGHHTGGVNNAFCGYMAETCLIDGSALPPTDFGEYDEDSGIWKPKDISELTFGTRGWWLDFSDSSSLGTDASGSGNNFTATNITSADQAVDTPTNNFCTLNYINKCDATIISDGATNCDRTNNGNNTVRGTYHLSRGKWYYEVAIYRGTINANYPFVGWTGNNDLDPCAWNLNENKTWVISGSGGVTDVSTARHTGTAAAQDPSYSIYGIAFDIDNQQILWHTNGTYNNSGNPISVANATNQAIVTEQIPMTPSLFMFTGANQSFNFGGYSVITPASVETDANGYGKFEYPVPSGYYAICSKNVAEYG